MQVAISKLDNWSKVAVYLSGKPEELKALAEQFTADPIAAATKLGRLEEKITAITPVKAPTQQLPPPVKKAVASEGTAGEFDWESATTAQKRAQMQRMKMI